MSDAVKTETIRLGASTSVGKHPAKMHTGLAWSLVREYSKPGDLVLDPFCGAGTTLWALDEGRRGLGVEIETRHVQSARAHGCTLRGDATRLPLQDDSVDAVVTSPPYGEQIGRAGDRAPQKTARAKRKYEIARFGRQLTKHAVYGDHPRNLGAVPLRRENSPCFVEMMPLAIREMVRVAKPGAFVVVVVKDQRLGRRREGAFDLPGSIVKWGQDAGAIFWGRRFGVLPESHWTLWQRVNEKRWGSPIPDVEHVIVLRKTASSKQEEKMSPKLRTYREPIEKGAPHVPDESIDVAVFSPPYFQKHGYSTGLMVSLGQTLSRVLKPGGRVFMVFGQTQEDLDRPFRAKSLLTRSEGNTLRDWQTIVWVKSVVVDGLQRNHFQPINSPNLLNYCSEFVFQFIKGEPKDAKPLDRLSIGVKYADESNLTRDTRGKNGNVHCAGDTWLIGHKTTGAHRKKPHPHSFPFKLAMNCLKLCSVGPGSTVFEPFLGGGTTVLAAFKLGADAYGIDINPEAVAFVRKRWKKRGGKLVKV